MGLSNSHFLVKGNGGFSQSTSLVSSNPIQFTSSVHFQSTVIACTGVIVHDPQHHEYCLQLQCHVYYV